MKTIKRKITDKIKYPKLRLIDRKTSQKETNKNQNQLESQQSITK